MSYKVEISTDDHESALKEAINEWSKQNHDVHLVSKEGHRIFSHKVLLLFYSDLLKQIFSEPSLAFPPNPVTISVPSSSACISSLLKVLMTGKSSAIQRSDLEEVESTASVLGIKLKNCVVDNVVSQRSRLGLTIVKLPEKPSSASDQSSSKTVDDNPLRYEAASSLRAAIEETLSEETPSQDAVQEMKDINRSKIPKVKLKKEM